MDSIQIKKIMEPEVASRGCFIVDVAVSQDNDIVLTVESETEVVDMDDCVALNDRFLELFDRDVEDYSLTVSSAGLDMPFKVLKQYYKAVGSMVEVWLKGGAKIKGRLAAADGNGIVLEYEAKEAVEGKKRKELVRHSDSFGYTELNAVYPVVSFDE